MRAAAECVPIHPGEKQAGRSPRTIRRWFRSTLHVVMYISGWGGGGVCIRSMGFAGRVRRQSPCHAGACIRLPDYSKLAVTFIFIFIVDCPQRAWLVRGERRRVFFIDRVAFW